jgi:hypothetical protein
MSKNTEKKKQEQRYSYDSFLQEAHRILLNTPPSSSSAQTYPPKSTLPRSRLIVVSRRHLNRFFPKPVEKKKTETEISRPNFRDLEPKTRNTKNPQENHRSSLSQSLRVSLSSVLSLASECLLLHFFPTHHIPPWLQQFSYHKQVKKHKTTTDRQTDSEQQRC